MAERLKVDLCVIGAGSGGLAVAAGASQLGASVALIERHKMGGDCLNYGCVPSKSLIAAAKAAQAQRESGRFGVRPVEPQIDFRAVHDHVHGVIAAIAPHDSEARFTGLGVRVIRASARFTGPAEVAAGGCAIEARRFVVATGSAPSVPDLPGLAELPYMTNETVFDRTELPRRLLVIGGGPIGLELAQAHRRLGAEVVVVAGRRALPKDDPELAAVVLTRLRREGVEILEGARAVAARPAQGGLSLEIEQAGARRRLEGSDLLVAAGRKANLDGLGLDTAGVETTPTGVKVDARLRTTNRRIYAIGDAAGGLQFTHLAGYHAGIVLRNALFRLPAKATAPIPWATYTDPELAHVGLNEAQAREAGHELRILRWTFAENDRAQAERASEGLVKVVATARGRILGASIAGAHAGELIQPWVLALANKLPLSKMAGVVAPYPTFGEVGKRAAGSFFMPKLFSARTRAVVRFLARFG
jgi:pyruvate/2-oxoglutarate dehydrogenase complex dihydrolipoamide dehydrogenase (E3) component